MFGKLSKEGANARRPDDDRTMEVESTQLLRTLIRNACVNDGTVASGQEVRSADALEDYFAGSRLSLERYAATRSCSTATTSGWTSRASVCPR